MRTHADHPPSLYELRRAYQPYRKKPYVARWYEAAPSSAKAADGKLRQRNRFFATAAARDEFIAQFKQTAQRQDPEICGLLALGAFAGMRSSAIARIGYTEIDFKQGDILSLDAGQGQQTFHPDGATRRDPEAVGMGRAADPFRETGQCR